MKPAYFELVIYCGATVDPASEYFVYEVDAAPVNLTGYTASLVARDKTGVELLRLDTDNGGIVITPAAGKIGLHITATQTAALQRHIKGPPTKQADAMPLYAVGKWSMEIDNAGTVTRLLQGDLVLSPEYTYA